MQLRRGTYADALENLQAAIKLDPQQYILHDIRKYPLEKLLGAGGMGCAFLCENKNRLIPDKWVVVKCFWENLSGTIDEVFKEPISMHQVAGDYVPKPLDYGYADVLNQARAYFVTEYVEGAIDGEAWLNKYGKMDLKTALRVGLQIAKGLEMSHQKGIYHLDLKPANILLQTSDVSVKIIDFGLSQVAPSLVSGQKKSGLSGFGQAIFGTWDYAPPEQQGEYGKPSASSDVYAFGRTLYRFLTGLSPRHFSPRKLPKVPALQELLFDCVEEEPSHRPSLTELLSQLEAIEASQDGELFDFEIVTVNAKGQITERIRKEARYQTENLGKGVELEMVSIQGGTFMMGSPESEERREDKEGPQHNVRVEKPFYMGKYPVTQAQWEVLMGNNPSSFKGKNRPVENVSWDDAVEFCKRLSEMTGKTYRLPSEAQWEYACRAGTTTPFYFGETITTDLANYDGNYTYAEGPEGVDRQETTELGSFPPNAFGLYDMHGNIWEWCADSSHNSYEGAPSDGSVWEGSSGSRRVLRGGSWGYNPDGCRTARRLWGDPCVRNFNVGFRVVWVARI
ncbi:hypothetical protein PN36_06920 [Candidatus Thiomargarita nelsonii]|uniref:Protein kinase domain-containing protein n=1 Tax=Candidatus Thiomargarita nelsonii TaxID=1003181 RepID=A0A0A6PJ19_9GAMM|nr:hypothetical protein PN36_06920 [Candidatus Thiomargarita nelsonii]